MKFSSPSDVSSLIQQMRFADQPRGRNRANIQRLFNGEPPYTAAEARANNIQTNVNFLEGTKILHDARQNWNNAFLRGGKFFSVTLTEGDPLKRREWASIITTRINRVMKNSHEYLELFQAVGANMFLHGPGPSIWGDPETWCPEAKGVEDILVPSNTLKSLRNLNHFAVYREFSTGELYRLTHGKEVRDKGWNMKLVDRCLTALKNENIETTAPDAVLSPEKLAERYKSNLGYYDSDATPRIRCWDFYYQDEEDESWSRRIVLDPLGGEPTGGAGSEWLYEKDSYASSRSEILHLNFADGANKAPFYYHSVRSLGWLLYDVCRLQNRMRSKFNDAVFEQLLWYFYVSSPEDRDRLQKIELGNMGIIPEGMRFVPAGERFQPRADLVQMAMGQNRQNMAENSASFTQDVNDGTGKEMTATETMARVNAANSLVSAMLNLAYAYEKQRYIEIARRFCIKGSRDKEVQKFREDCLKDGVPEEMLYCELWEIEPEKAIGAGNKVMQIAQSDKLMAARNLYDGDAQREILHLYTEVNTDDPSLANRLVPLKKDNVNDAILEAQYAAGALMQGLPVAIKQDINHIDYVDAMLVSVGSKVQQIASSGGVPEGMDVLNGLQACAQHVQQHIQIVAQDQNEKERVKKWMDTLGKIMNQVKAFGQRLQEKMAQEQASGGVDPETQAKVQSMMMLAQSKAQIGQANAALKGQQKQVAFDADQQRKNISTIADLQRQQAQMHVDIAATDALTAADIRRTDVEHKSDGGKVEQ